MSHSSPFHHPLACRSAGILLHPTSLPGPYGIGDLGPAAREWIDALAAAGQSWWQVLPLGPTGYGDSPYQCFSAFAGNPNLISPDDLVGFNLLDRDDISHFELPVGPVDFARVSIRKREMLERAWGAYCDDRGRYLADEWDHFRSVNSDWLDDFALFMALKQELGGGSWLGWPDHYRLRKADALASARCDLANSTERHRFAQFLFFRQWDRLREYAHSKGVRIIGDMPIFVAEDSADVSAHPELFQLDADRRPQFVAGVPPDYFSTTGQLWGNPLYAWEEHARTNYAWWVNRVRHVLQQVDLIRLDHFRGFEAYWSVPAGSTTAEAGRWVSGPGGKLLHALETQLGGLPLIAEDLGVITPAVDAIRREFALPGMRVLQFAFGGAVENRFLPHNFENPTVVYTGTHDNDTTRGWFAALTPTERTFTLRYLNTDGSEIAWDLIRSAWASAAELAMAPAQDLLDLGSEARMNIPGRADGNWRWRLPAAGLGEGVVERLRDMTMLYERGAKQGDDRP